MLWYQYEPILSYYEIGEYDTALGLATKIINNNNRAYSEMYIIRGDIYLKQGDKNKAREQYELALFYNSNLEDAKDRLKYL
jgi:predicted negative regulator of RcsB-dependent stress response